MLHMYVALELFVYLEVDMYTDDGQNGVGLLTPYWEVQLLHPLHIPKQ